MLVRVLGTCIGVVSVRGCNDGDPNFELSGDRPIVRSLWSAVVVMSDRVMLVYVLFLGTMGDVVGVGCVIDEDIVPELAGDRPIAWVWLLSFDEASDGATSSHKG